MRQALLTFGLLVTFGSLIAPAAYADQLTTLAMMSKPPSAGTHIQPGHCTTSIWDGRTVTLDITSVDSVGAPHGTISYTTPTGRVEGPYSFNASGAPDGSIQRGSTSRYGENFLNMRACGQDLLCAHHVHDVIAPHAGSARSYNREVVFFCDRAG